MEELEVISLTDSVNDNDDNYNSIANEKYITKKDKDEIMQYMAYVQKEYSDHKKYVKNYDASQVQSKKISEIKNQLDNMNGGSNYYKVALFITCILGVITFLITYFKEPQSQYENCSIKVKLGKYEYQMCTINGDKSVTGPNPRTGKTRAWNSDSYMYYLVEEELKKGNILHF